MLKNHLHRLPQNLQKILNLWYFPSHFLMMIDWFFRWLEASIITGHSIQWWTVDARKWRHQQQLQLSPMTGAKSWAKSLGFWKLGNGDDFVPQKKWCFGGSGFKYVCLFIPKIGEDEFQFDSHFSNGLKPPTSFCFFGRAAWCWVLGFHWFVKIKIYINSRTTAARSRVSSENGSENHSPFDNAMASSTSLS